MIKRILFITTNDNWGGSEELWLRSAQDFETKGYEIFTIARYQNEKLKKLHRETFIYKNHYQISRRKKLLKKLRLINNKTVNPLYTYINKIQPELIIISQGANMSSFEILNFCCTTKFKFITITQLVAEMHFSAFNNEELRQWRDMYSKALINFFVSEHNLQLNNFMLGVDLSNASTIPNPCRVYGAQSVAYPSKNTYNIALVSRTECYEKGYDLLLKIIDAEKWKTRNIHFNIYGTGRNFCLIKELIHKLQLNNVSMYGHAEDIQAIWQNNHILFMPSRFEGQALALIEAMYFGRAAVVTNVGGIKELITNRINGFISETASVNDIDKTLEEAWTERNNWENMGSISREIILEKYKIPAEVMLNDKILALLN